MELMAVCVALEALKFAGSDVVVYPIRKYVVDAVTKGWVFGWEKKGFAGKKNPRSVAAISRRIPPSPRAFRLGESGHAETVENNRCDQMAVAAANGRDLLVDTGYEEARQEGSAAAAVNRRPTRSSGDGFLSKTFGVAGKSLI